MAAFAIYKRTELGAALEQGEIISGLYRYTVTTPFELDKPPQLRFAVLDFVVVLSQTCDLTARIPVDDRGVLLCEARLLQDLPRPGGSDILRKIKNNLDHRYQYLRQFEADVDSQSKGSTGALYLDFRRIFSVPCDELMFQVGDSGPAKRRCSLEVPYREHLAARYAGYLARVALPADHNQDG